MTYFIHIKINNFSLITVQTSHPKILLEIIEITVIGTPLNSSEDGNIFKQVKTSSVMFLEGLNDCFHQVPFFFLLILGNHHNVLCTATLAVSVRVLFFKFTALRILMTRNTHSKWNMMLLFLKKMIFHFTELHSCKNEGQLLKRVEQGAKSTPPQCPPITTIRVVKLLPNKLNHA